MKGVEIARRKKRRVLRRAHRRVPLLLFEIFMADCCGWSLSRGDFGPRDKTIFPEKYGGSRGGGGKKSQRGES